MWLADEDILSDDLLRQLISVGEVDILVGLHTHNHAKTIGHVVQVIREGLLKYFPRERVAILNADGGSHDGTPDLVRAASINDARNASSFEALRTMHCVSSQYSGDLSNGKAMHIVVAAADLLRAKACAVIAPESSEIQPEWIDRLLRPIYREHVDLVTPVYRRHRFEGMLVTNLMYPMTRALYGKSIREPRPGEFAFSDRLASQLVGHEMWTSDAGRLGPEVCFTMTALAEGLPVFQTFLGTQGASGTAIHRPGFCPAADGGATVLVHGTVACIVERHSRNPGCAYGGPGLRGDHGRGHRGPLRVCCRCSVPGWPTWNRFSSPFFLPRTLEQLQRAAALERGQVPLFRRVVGDRRCTNSPAAYHRSVISRDHIIQALAPLYRGQGIHVSDREPERFPGRPGSAASKLSV